MDSVSLVSEPEARCNVKTELKHHNSYVNINCIVMKACCVDTILGYNVLKYNFSVELNFGGTLPIIHSL